MNRNVLYAIASVSVIFLLASWYYPNIREQDIGIYNRIGSDVQKIHEGNLDKLESEYPPIASSVFYLVADNPFNAPFETAWIVFIILSLLATCIYARYRLAKGDQYLLPLSIALSIFLLGPKLIFARYDFIVSILILLSWRTFKRERFTESSMFLTIAAAFKIVPILLFPILFFTAPITNRKKIINGFLIGVAISFAVPLLMLGPRTSIQNIQHMTSYHSGRGIQIESTWSSVSLLIRALQHREIPIGVHSMSYENASFADGSSAMAMLILLIGVLYFTFRYYKRKQLKDMGIGFAFILLWSIGTSPVLSPQYFVWVVPIIVLWLIDSIGFKKYLSRQDVMILLLLVFMSVSTQWIFPYNYDDIIRQNSILSITILFLRNLSIFGLAFMLWNVNLKKGRRESALIKLLRNKGIVLFALVLVAIIYSSARPDTGQVLYKFDNEESGEAAIPFFIDSKDEFMNVSFRMKLGVIHPASFLIKPDDCIEQLTINGQSVDPKLIKFCDYGLGRNIYLGEYLKTGSNLLQFRIRDTGGKIGINMRGSRTDPAMLGMQITLISLLLWILFLILRSSGKNAWSIGFTGVILGGLFLRFIYVLASPVGTRGHDTYAHIDYIKYVSQNWNIPAAVGAWEYHQPPLYYFIYAIWMKQAEAMGWTSYAILRQFQFGALVFSFLCFALAGWMAKLLFPGKKNRRYLILFTGIVAVFPSLIFVSSRISNDTLYTFLAFLSLAILLHWWRGKGTVTSWYALSIVIGIALITKVSTLLLMPVIFICLLFKKHMTIREKILHGGVSALLIMLIAGWLPIVRFTEKDPTRSLTLGNDGTSGALYVGNSLKNWTTFNPMGVLKNPYNNPWVDESRRAYFWEYYFRSFFSGEFTLGNKKIRSISILIILTAILLIPIAFIGIWKSIRKSPYKTLPIILVFVFLLIGSIGYRTSFPYANNQDFRFSVLSVVPMAYFVARGIRALPYRLKNLGFFTATSFCFLCAILIVSLYFAV